MLYKKIKYKGYSFSPADQIQNRKDFGYSIVLENMDLTLELETDVFGNANYHGAFASASLANRGRNIDISGTIAGTTKEQREEGWRKLCEIINIEGNINQKHRGFYDLFWETGKGEQRTLKAKVLKLPRPTNGLSDPIISFTFQLFSETEKIYGPEWKQVVGEIGAFGGSTLPNTLPTVSNGYVNTLMLYNAGNYEAPVRISVVGRCLNPKIINATNGMKYKIIGETNNLLMDNININNINDSKFIVTDNGADIRARRLSGSPILLSPGMNEIAVLSDISGEGVVVTASFRDTYYS